MLELREFELIFNRNEINTMNNFYAKYHKNLQNDSD